MTEYRKSIFPVVLAAIFTVFNVGIPIVLASCPMMSRNSRACCCPAPTEAGKTALSSSRDYSCCRTVIAATGNTTEFIAAKIQQVLPVQPALPLSLLQQSILAEIYATPQPFIRYHSPPITLDLPVITSSLLI